MPMHKFCNHEAGYETYQLLIVHYDDAQKNGVSMTAGY